MKIKKQIETIKEMNKLNIVHILNSNKDITIDTERGVVEYTQKIILTGTAEQIGKHLGSIILEFNGKQKKLIHLIFRTEKLENINYIDEYDMLIDI